MYLIIWKRNEISFDDSVEIVLCGWKLQCKHDQCLVLVYISDTTIIQNHQIYVLITKMFLRDEMRRSPRAPWSEPNLRETEAKFTVGLVV